MTLRVISPRRRKIQVFRSDVSNFFYESNRLPDETGLVVIILRGYNEGQKN